MEEITMNSNGQSTHMLAEETCLTTTANLDRLSKILEIRSDLPEIELTEEELRYLEQHGTLPDSSLMEPLQI